MKIAIARRNRMGDFISALPLVAHCKKIYPDAKITLFLSPLAMQLAPYIEGIGETVAFPSKGNRYWNMLKFGFLYRKRGYDLAISAKPSPMRILNVFLWALGAKKSVAVVKKKTFLVNGGIEESSLQGKHQALRILQMIAPELKEIPEEYYPKIEMPNESQGEHFLFISLINNRTSSQIGIEKYERILNRYKNLSIVISCTEKERELAEKLQKRLQQRAVIAITPHFDDFMKLIASCSYFFIGDGGIMHLVAAFDKPQVVLFGHVRIEEWRPLSKKAIVLGNFSDVNEIEDEEIHKALDQMFSTT